MAGETGDEDQTCADEINGSTLMITETTSKQPPIITLDNDDVTGEDDSEGDVCGDKDEKICDSGTCTIQHITVAVSVQCYTCTFNVHVHVHVCLRVQCIIVYLCASTMHAQTY